MAQEEKLSPMYEQYLAVKKEYPDGFLFYRMGDFYELFFDDAVEVARELQLTLTKRSKNSTVPMAGVPHHALENYASQLIDKGYSLVICDQVEDPKKAKGLVKRAVTRIITPGTILETSNLNAKEYNYLGAYFSNTQTGLYAFAWLDATTGDWTGFESNKESEVIQWVLKISPRELLLLDTSTPPLFLKQAEGIQKTFLPLKSHFDKNKSQDILKRVQNVQDMASLGIENNFELIRCCGALLYYLEQTQKQNINYIKPFRPLQLKKYMTIDEITEKNLELFMRSDGKKGLGTLIHAIDETMTPAGGRLLAVRLRQPFAEKEHIINQQKAVQYFIENNSLRNTIREKFRAVYDIERLSTKVHLNRAFPKDMKALGEALRLLPQIYADFFLPTNEEIGKKIPIAPKEIFDNMPSLLRDILKNWDSLEDISHLLFSAISDEASNSLTDGGIFKKGYDQKLDHYIELIENTETLLNQELAKEQKESNLPKLKLGYNRVFGYYYELTNTNIPLKLPEHFVRKQTLGNAERYSTASLTKLDQDILSATEIRKPLEAELYQKLREKICAVRSRLTFMADAIAHIDISQAFAEIAIKNNWVAPDIENDIHTKIVDGRHPVIEPLIGRTNFVPNSLTFDPQKRLLLITGPNMSGKSTVLRQTALITLLAQMGAYVPATKAVIGICDRIFSRVGASDNLARGQSTFMVEMMETARILRQSSKRSLIILDEIGRGTSTYDGLSLAWAIVEDLTKKGVQSPRTLFATHYHELTSLEGNQQGVYTTNVAIREWKGEIVFLRKLVPGPTDKSYGIEVAKLAGIPAQVVQRAKAILQYLEEKKDSAKPISLETSSKESFISLPGIELPQEEVKEDFYMPKAKEQAHPVVELLYDLKPEELSPMQALSLLAEWKELWGKSK